MKKRRQQNACQIVVFIASNFDEHIVTMFLEQMETLKRPISLVGLTKDMIPGKWGLLAQPTYQIDEMVDRQKVCLLLVPGDATCASALMIDPRFHHILHKTLAFGGTVAIASGAQKVLHEGSLPILGTPGFQYLKQGEQENSVFIQQLFKQIIP